MYKPDNYSIPHFEKKIYCSNKCSASIRKTGKIIPCGYCKKKIYSRPKVGEKFCSKKCFDLVRKGKTVHNTGQFKKGIHPLTQFNNGHLKPLNAYKWGKREMHPNWKGGITPINARIRGSVRYKQWRIAVFERDNYTCQMCNERGRELNVDHIKPFSIFKKLRFTVSNGRTLCKKCHLTTDTYAGKMYSYQTKTL
jgi:hypothetical protein|tara:strand:+ start:873 stop:1457 length:585 start_codon:yes stop_codon:yes gene_type:complete